MAVTNPMAGASGPNKFSARTDLPPSKEYGERKQLEEIMGGAAMASTPDVSPMSRSEMGAAPSQLTSLFADSQRPDEDVMAGSPIGPGPGREALAMSNARQADADIISKYMPALDAMASAPDSPQSFRIFVRNLQGNL